MHLLILSCNTGEGHNSAAKALRHYALDRGDTCDIQDALAFWTPEASKIISKGHVFLYRHFPKLFGVGYRFEENHPPKDGDESIMYTLVKKGCEDLSAFLLQGGYDAVICTHLFPAMMMTELRRNGSIKLPTYFVATDYSSYPGVGEIEVDRCFIAHPDLIQEYIQCGIPKEKLVASGIPVHPNFYRGVSQQEARRLLHLPQDKKIVLLMSGSMGCGPIKELTVQLPKALPKDVQLVAICGNNRRLANFLTRNDPPENLTVVGYTVRMPLYMDAADLYITKPGGLSSTEAVAKRLPLIFIDAVPGCESKNLDFFAAQGIAESRSSVEDLINLICTACADDEKLANVSAKMATFLPTPATETIYQYLCKDVLRENH